MQQKRGCYSVISFNIYIFCCNADYIVLDIEYTSVYFMWTWMERGVVRGILNTVIDHSNPPIPPIIASIISIPNFPTSLLNSPKKKWKIYIKNTWNTFFFSFHFPLMVFTEIRLPFLYVIREKNVSVDWWNMGWLEWNSGETIDFLHSFCVYIFLLANFGLLCKLMSSIREWKFHLVWHFKLILDGREIFPLYSLEEVKSWRLDWMNGEGNGQVK